MEILKAKEAGAKTVDLCREHGIDEATFHRWKARYGGMTLLDAERLIPTCTNQNAFAQSRSPMDMMRQGCATSLFQASQQ